MVNITKEQYHICVLWESEGIYDILEYAFALNLISYKEYKGYRCKIDSIDEDDYEAVARTRTAILERVGVDSNIFKCYIDNEVNIVECV